MTCTSVTAALWTMLIGASTAAGVEAQAFRQEAIHRARIAHALARREMLARQAEQNGGACGDSFLSAIGCAIQHAIDTVANSSASIAQTAYHSISVDSTESAERMVESALGQDKQGVCMGSLCGFSLLFMTIWALFALAFVVVYIKDKTNSVVEPTVPIEVDKLSEQRAPEQTTDDVRASRHPMVLRQRRPVKTVS